MSYPEQQTGLVFVFGTLRVSKIINFAICTIQGPVVQSIMFYDFK